MKIDIIADRFIIEPINIPTMDKQSGISPSGIISGNPVQPIWYNPNDKKDHRMKEMPCSMCNGKGRNGINMCLQCNGTGKVMLRIDYMD